MEVLLLPQQEKGLFFENDDWMQNPKISVSSL